MNVLSSAQSIPTEPIENQSVDHPERPTRDDLLLRCFLILGALPGFFVFNSAYNPYPVTQYLDIVIAILACRALRTRYAGHSMLYAIPIGYVLIKFALMTVGYKSSPIDFVQAYKAYIFLAVVACFVGEARFTGKALAVTLRILLILFAVKYSIGLIVGVRPMLFTENNYELMTLIGFLYFAYPFILKYRAYWLFLSFYVVAISQSRSSALELFICVFALHFHLLPGKFLSSIVPVMAAVGGAKYVFDERMTVGGVGAVDRLVFLQIFMDEVRQWSIFDWLLGAIPLTPLSNASCDRMSFYHALFSLSGDGKCYSVVLHSFAMRVLFDQGVLGFILLLWCLWRLLRRSGATKRDVLGLVGIGLANSLSVSAFNSEYFLMVAIVAVGLRRSARATAASSGVVDPGGSRVPLAR